MNLHEAAGTPWKLARSTVVKKEDFPGTVVNVKCVSVAQAEFYHCFGILTRHLHCKMDGEWERLTSSEGHPHGILQLDELRITHVLLFQLAKVSRCNCDFSSCNLKVSMIFKVPPPC